MESTDKFILDRVKEVVSDSNLLKENTKKAVLSEKKKIESEYVEERDSIEEKIQRIQRQIDNIENNIVDLEVEKGMGKKEERIVNKVISRYESELEKLSSEYKKLSLIHI